MSKSSLHFRGQEKKQLEAGNRVVSYPSRSKDEEEKNNVNSEGISSELQEMDFRRGRKYLALQFEAMIGLNQAAWDALKPKIKAIALYRELIRRSGPIEKTIEVELEGLITRMDSEPSKVWNEADWEECLEKVLTIAEEERPSPIEELKSIKNFRHYVNTHSYKEWCILLFGETCLERNIACEAIELEFLLWKAYYPAHFLTVWKLGNGDKKLAFKKLLNACIKLDKKNKDGKHYQKKQKINPTFLQRTNQSPLICQCCGGPGHLTKACPKAIRDNNSDNNRGNDNDSNPMRPLNDNQSMKHNHYIDTQDPGELVGIDLMECRNKSILVAIDYYTRMAFTFQLRKKQAHRIVACLDTMYSAFPFQKVICGNEKEFDSALLKEWLRKRGVCAVYWPSYFHEGNGRVKRLIRTLQDSLNRTKGSVKQKLKKVTNAYNKTVHRAIGMSPHLALLPENRANIELAIAKYKREFEKTPDSTLAVGTKVLIRKEIHDKDDKHIEREGSIVSQVGLHSYKMAPRSGKNSVRNGSQLKGCLIEEEDDFPSDDIGIPLQEWKDHYYDD
ncbi:hypothetical protein NEIRO03_1805 [Nematocida sp. AWRm78]|nr:hypothetical protein NEIRO02_1828 [Nematocida sp. AWRm79]KAI5184677.1 hypothetical protein NEIRO03_1805 [Nematocida sp. AWRm78]